MIAFYIGIFLLCLFGIKISRKGFFDDFLGMDQSNSIKGIFILMVFTRHVFQYIYASGYQFVQIQDKLFFKIDHELEQLIVVMFLFYSGYGVMESIAKKKLDYIREMPKKRILTTILNFDVAVLFFFVLNIIIDKEMTLQKVALSLIGWESLGNSNWYIFVIVLCYTIAWISFSITARQKELNTKRATLLAMFLFIAALIALSLTRSVWWYNTLLSFAVGMLFSEFKESIVPFIKKYYWKFLVLAIALFVGFHILPNGIFCIWYNLESIAFALCVVAFTLKVQVNNVALRWLGKHLFPLYIYQRLAMIVLYEMDNGTFVKNNPILYTVICFVFMILVAIPYRYWQITLSKKTSAS